MEFIPPISRFCEEFLCIFLVHITDEMKKISSGHHHGFDYTGWKKLVNRKAFGEHPPLEAKYLIKRSGDHQAKGGGTSAREIEEFDSTISVLSQIIATTLIREQIKIAREASTYDYVRNYSLCNAPHLLLPLRKKKTHSKFVCVVDTLGSDSDTTDHDSDTTDHDDDDHHDHHYEFNGRRGRPLLEVFSVVVIKNGNIMDEKGPPGQGSGVSSVYGAIVVDDGLRNPVYIYSREKEDSESISLSQGGDTADLLLTGPARPIYSADGVCIEVALIDDNDEVITEGNFSWDPYACVASKYEGGKLFSDIGHDDPKTTIYNKLLATNIDGCSGFSVTLNYILFLGAVVATVEVTLLNNLRGYGATNVYGLIQAGSNCGSSTYWSVLFRKNDDEYIDVRPEEHIPLSRSLVALHKSSSLNVSAALYDCCDNRDLSIANGTVVFPAQCSGTYEKNLSGGYGEIRVKVTWR